jgi:excisionase family DNA binding protein
MTKDAIRPERIRCDEAAAILGVRTRTVQALALRGELPGAARIGGLWTFSEAALRKYIEERTQWPKDRRPRSTPIGAAERYGRGSPLADVNIERACALASQRLRERAYKR